MKVLKAMLAIGLVWINTLAAERITWEGKGKEVEFTYSGKEAYIEIQAFSDEYTYCFEMHAEKFSGTFSGTGLGFMHSFEFSNGGYVSIIDAKGTVLYSGSLGDTAKITETLNKAGLSSDLTVRVVIEGRETTLKIEKPERAEVKPVAIIRARYLRNENGVIVGGYFENVGTAPFYGKIAFVLGLSYNQKWIAESVTHYAKGESCLIVLNPRDKLPFYFIRNPLGGVTFIFPTILMNNSPLSFSVFPPAPDSPAVSMFKEMIYKWWTGYKDPEPDVDYVNSRIYLIPAEGDVSNSLYFWHPITPYFAPPR
ncbi:hypothetical protein H5T58_01405 [Candidatus Parcubacteria bacterium]|nr:hypothetical protein [Candidatus Parcubacteria bacterium]